MSTDRTVIRWVTLAAAVLTLGTVVLTPAVWFLLSYQRMAGSLEAEAEINSQTITQIIGANPDLWEFEQTRLTEYLGRRPRRGDEELRRVVNRRGEVVAESADPIQRPWISRSVPLLDAGATVGRLEISRSLRPLVRSAGFLALLLVPTGLVAFLALRNFPLRALRRSEAAIRRERDTAQLYLDAAGVLFVVLDDRGRVSRINRMAAETLGRDEAGVLGCDWVATVVKPADRERAASAIASARSGESTTLEHAVVNPAGDSRIVAWYATQVADESPLGPSVLLSGVDVTRQRQLEDQLRHTHRLRAIGQLAGGVAHDFSVVLSQIKQRAAVLRAGLDLGNPHRLDADEILGAADRATSLTNSLLTFSRRQAVNPELVDLAELLRRSKERLARRLHDEIDLVLELPTRPLTALVDPAQIEQLVLNLVTNAQDAIPGAGRIVLGASVAILDAEEARLAGLIAPGTYARISVTDDGAGLEPETRTRAFEPFFTTKGQGKGQGLGLAIAYGIVELHNGAIRIESAPGRGATVTFLLPLRPGAKVDEGDG